MTLDNLTPAAIAALAYAADGKANYPFRVVMMHNDALKMVSICYAHFDPANDFACALIQTAFPDLPDGMLVHVQHWDGNSWRINRSYTHEHNA